MPFNGLSHSDIESAKAEDSELTRLKSRLPSDIPLVLRNSIEAATKYMPLERASLEYIKDLLLREQAQVICEFGFIPLFLCASSYFHIEPF